MPKSKQFLSMSWVLGLSLVYGCSTPVPQPVVNPSVSPVPTTSPEPIPTPISTPLPSPTAVSRFHLNAEQVEAIKNSPLTTANNIFSWNLFSQIFESDPTGNHFISGLSATLALQMVLAGTEGESRDEMLKLLALEDISREQLTEDIPLFMQRLTQNPEVRLDIANSLWSGESYPLNPDWVNFLQTQFKADAEQIDFTNSVELERTNQWVEQKTRGKITKIIPNPYPDASSVIFILMNAIYFKGDWSYEFDPLETRERPFFVKADKQVSVQMMRQFNEFRYRTPDFKFPHQSVALPYGENESLKMYVFLPSADKSLTDLMSDLKSTTLEKILPEFYAERGSLRLPKFKMEKEILLNNVLTQMGAQKTLAPHTDFKGLLNPGEAEMNRIIHKTFVEVNEKGTEAAAVTAITFYPTPSSLPMRTMDMNVNRPFLFLIRDEATSQILFMGSVNNPNSDS